MDDALMVRRVGELILAGERGRASALLASIPRWTASLRPRRRRSPRRRCCESATAEACPPLKKFAAHERYGWRCQYCGRRVVIAGMLELVDRLCPELRWWPNDNMPKALTHPAAVRLYPNADHIKARAVGGHATADDNLICSCTTCNERKGIARRVAADRHERAVGRLCAAIRPAVWPGARGGGDADQGDRQLAGRRCSAWAMRLARVCRQAAESPSR
jgi:hypothetical protein